MSGDPAQGGQVSSAVSAPSHAGSGPLGGLWQRVGAGLRRTAPLRVWAAVSTMYLLAYVSVVSLRPLYVGDSRYYAALALWLGGTDRDDAYRTVVTYTGQYHIATPPQDVLFTQGLTGPRLLYPLLSAPFVRLFGLDGMAIVPALSFFALGAVLLITTAGRWGWVATLAPMLLVGVDWRLTYYCVIDATEGLTTLLSALILLVVLRRSLVSTRITVVWLMVLTTLLGFTRQATVIPAGAFLLAWFALWLRRGEWRNQWAMPALVTTATTAVVMLVQGIMWPGFSPLQQLEKATGTTSFVAAVQHVPRLTVHILRTDARTLLTADLPVVLLLVAALLSLVVMWRHEETYLLIGAVAASLVYNVTNGTPAAFRYQMPALPFFVLSVAGLAWYLGAGRTITRRRWPRLPVRARTPTTS